MNKKALSKISYGLYVAATSLDGKLNGCIVNTVFQITNKPIILAVSIAKENLTHDMAIKSGFLTVSTLTQDCPVDTIAIFGFNSGRDTEKFSKVKYELDSLGGPILQEYTCSSYSLKITSTVDAFKHTIFVCELMDMEVLSNGTPMTYAYYKDVIKGGAPAAAPTAIEADEEIEGTYTCSVCKYVYNPQNGDAKGGVNAGTPFEELPDGWVCPVCKKGKDVFHSTN